MSASTQAFAGPSMALMTTEIDSPKSGTTHVRLW